MSVQVDEFLAIGRRLVHALNWYMTDFRLALAREEGNMAERLGAVFPTWDNRGKQLAQGKYYRQHNPISLVSAGLAGGGQGPANTSMENRWSSSGGSEGRWFTGEAIFGHVGAWDLLDEALGAAGAPEAFPAVWPLQNATWIAITEERRITVRGHPTDVADVWGALGPWVLHGRPRHTAQSLRMGTPPHRAQLIHASKMDAAAGTAPNAAVR